MRTARAMRARCLGNEGACLARYNRVGSAAFAMSRAHVRVVLIGTPERRPL